MGGCFSQEASPKVKPARKAQINENVVIPRVTWEVDESWANESEAFRQIAIERGVDASTAYQNSMFKRAIDWLNRFVSNIPLSFVVETQKQTIIRIY